MKLFFFFSFIRSDELGKGENLFLGMTSKVCKTVFQEVNICE